MTLGRLLLLGIALLLAVGSPAAELRAATLPATISTSGNKDVIKASVEPFVKDQSAKLSNADPVVQKEGREALVAEVQSTAGAPPHSPQFRDVYAKAVNDALEPLTKNNDAHVRLNVAVTVARVAEKADNTQLVPIIVEILKDNNPAVALWGMKACKFVIPPVLSNPVVAKANPLIPAFKEAVTKHVNSGPMMQAAYEGLCSEGNAPALPAMIDLLHEVMTVRSDQYKAGVPAVPAHEGSPSIFLVRQNVWNAQKPPQQLRTLQLMSNLVSYAVQRAEKASPNDVNDLRFVVDKVGKSMYVAVGSWINDAAAAGKLAPIRSVGTTTPVEAMRKAVDPVYDALKQIPSLKDLKRPEVLPATSAAATTTTSPAQP